MKKLFVAALFLALTISVLAQNRTAVNLIDKRLNRCLDSTHSTTASMIECSAQAYKEWDVELNKYYKLLMATPDSETKTKLKTAQIAWLAYRDYEFILVDRFYTNDGTMWGPIRINKKMEIVRQRALDLKEYYDVLNIH